MSLPIQTFQLAKRYRSGFLIREITALKGVSLEVNSGEIFGFLGPNGAGKTTLIKILLGLMRPTSGSARLLGGDPGSIDRKRRVGYLPESPYFYEYLSAREFLQLSARLCRVPAAQQRGRIDRILEMVKLTGEQNRRLGRFSRGMLQRVGIAQALLHDPELVVLDEPMGGLDPIGRKEFRDIILSLRSEGKTVFFSTHILQDVEMICDRVGILDRGNLISVGRLDSILSAGAETIEVTVRGISEGAIRGQGVSPLQVIGDSDKLTVVVRNETEKAALLKLLPEQGGELISLVPRTRTLEDYFLAQVKGSQKSGL